MKGLLLKDLYILQHYKRTLVIQLAVVVVMCFLMPGNFIPVTTAILVTSSASMAIGNFAYDESANWQRFAAALPTKRSTIVAAKYLFSLFMLLGVVVVAVAVSLVAGFFTRQQDMLPTMISSTIPLFCFSLLSLSIGLPMAFRYGYQKARIIMTGSYIALFAIIALAFFLNGDLSFLQNIGEAGFVLILSLIPLVFIGLYFLSFTIAIRLYKKQDF